jgi:hypothetical protein
MFANAALFLALVTAVTLVTTSAVPSAPYVAPTTLSNDSEWNHEPFNVTAYLESAELEAAGKASPHAKRNRPGVYTCENANWGWPCWWQPAVGQCIHTDWGHDISIGPDAGVYCTTFDNDNCANDGIWNNFQKPGFSRVPDTKSFKCQTGYMY